MTDYSEGAEPDEQDAVSDPAQAFDALRRSIEKLTHDVGGEMTVIRKGVEAAFEEFEKIQQPPDYGPELGRIVKQVAVVGQHLEALQKLPALRNGPDHYARALENAGNRVSEGAARTIEARGQALERVTGDLREFVRTARFRREQDWWLCGVGAAGLVLGVMLTLFAPRVLPGSVDMAVASTAMNADRWNAGIALMQSASPGGWRNLVDANSLVRANQEALAACVETAAKAKKEQRCTVTVAVPAQ
ncbi:hypothetical protein EGT36_00025 [Agrobacterium sp. FDAARGOS_525]|uniref:DUF6118 family protein n=1 Tax=Agrobacterium sp. FDAARGOS_525 TaxID=2420311 RepID=UPI000DB72C67|nr:DUF6118 family protein [Agrobacterium sp. FDAARGOS_525]PZU69650.1 MAG: hypothetical protein DI546_19095 [Rhizobium sp.]RSC41593.1 hypothetical protein EGT36_00025 [Agrobacterium sp. FDAARGOS_525]